MWFNIGFTSEHYSEGVNQEETEERTTQFFHVWLGVWGFNLTFVDYHARYPLMFTSGKSNIVVLGKGQIDDIRKEVQICRA